MTEDCIAISEDGDWAAYPKTMKRGQVFSKLAANSSVTGMDWWTLTHHYAVRAGHVHEDIGEPGYWHEVEDGITCERCVACWIVRRK